jgi:hypothetical protein
VDPIGLAAAAAGAGMAAGLAMISTTVAAIGLVRSPAAGAEPDLGAPLVLLLAGTLGGLLLAGITTWHLLRVDSAYRRGGLAMVSSFGTVVLMLVTMPLNQVAGRAGLLGLAALAAVLALLLARRARRLGAAS